MQPLSIIAFSWRSCSCESSLASSRHVSYPYAFSAAARFSPSWRQRCVLKLGMEMPIFPIGSFFSKHDTRVHARSAVNSASKNLFMIKILEIKLHNNISLCTLFQKKSKQNNKKSLSKFDRKKFLIIITLAGSWWSVANSYLNYEGGNRWKIINIQRKPIY